MSPVDSDALAAHIAASLDGDWDDGIEAYVEAFASAGGLSVNLRSDGGDLISSFVFTITQTK